VITAALSIEVKWLEYELTNPHMHTFMAVCLYTGATSTLVSFVVVLDLSSDYLFSVIFVLL
jgi:hypothetical protein